MVCLPSVDDLFRVNRWSVSNQRMMRLEVMKKINFNQVKTIVKKWRVGDYLRQFSIVTAGIIVTFWGNDRIIEHARQKEVQATMQLIIEELKESRSKLQGVTKLMNVDRRISQLVLANDFNMESISTDTLKKYQSFFGNLSSFRYTTDALEVLKSSSLMQHVSDKKLLQDITRTYYQLNSARENIDSYYDMKSESINEVMIGLDEKNLNAITKENSNVRFTNFFFSCTRWRVFCTLLPNYLEWERFTELDDMLSKQIQTLEAKYN